MLFLIKFLQCKLTYLLFFCSGYGTVKTVTAVLRLRNRQVRGRGPDKNISFLYNGSVVRVSASYSSDLTLA